MINYGIYMKVCLEKFQNLQKLIVCDLKVSNKPSWVLNVSGRNCRPTYRRYAV
jgi:hypothetical protein